MTNFPTLCMMTCSNNERQKLLEESETALRIVDTLIKSNKVYEENPEKLIDARETIGNQIEKLGDNFGF